MYSLIEFFLSATERRSYCGRCLLMHPIDDPESPSLPGGGGLFRRKRFPLLSIMSAGFLVLFVGCKTEPLPPEIQEVRVAPVERSMNGTVIQLQGRVQDLGGGKHRIRLPFPCERDTALRARYTIVSPTLDRSRIAANPSGDRELVLSFIFESGLLDEMQVPVEVRGCGSTGWTVPVEAIRAPTGQEAFVYRIKGNRVEKVGPVGIQHLTGDRVQIDAPLEDGSTLVVEGLELVADGDEVEVLP